MGHEKDGPGHREDTRIRVARETSLKRTFNITGATQIPSHNKDVFQGMAAGIQGA